MSMSSEQYVCEFDLYEPDLGDIASVMRSCLKPYFSHLDIDVVKCPDLNVFPYYLRAPGMCGDGEVIQFGDYKYSYNVSNNTTKSWNFMHLLHMSIATNPCKTFFTIGGGGKFSGIPNKEVVRNFTYSWEKGIDHESNYIFLNEEEQVVTECEFDIVPSPRYHTSFYKSPLCDTYGSFYVCNGEQNNVLKVCARGACDGFHTQILNMMQLALSYKYPWSVGLSGLLVISSGTVETAAVQRTFSQTPLKTEDIYKWNKYNISSDIIIPLVVHNIMFNFNQMEVHEVDTKFLVNVNSSSSYILRGSELMGSRFLKSTMPCAMEFEGYFSVVSKLCRYLYQDELQTVTETQIDS